MDRKSYWRTMMTLVMTVAFLMTGMLQAADRPEMHKAASEDEDTPSKIVVWYYEETEYVIGGETQYTYTQDGNVQEEESLYYTDGVPQNSYRSTYEYDGQGNVLSSMDYQWGGGAWAEYMRTTCTYLEGKVTQSVTDVTDGTIWTTIYKDVTTYPDTNTIHVVSYGHIGTDWTPNSEYTMTVNANGDPTLVLSGTYYEGVYSQDGREVYEYNQDGTLATATMYNRESAEAPWEVHTMIEYTYDVQGKMTAEYMSMRSWDTGEMVQNHRITFAYDGEGRMSEMEMFFRETEDDPWEPGSKDVYVYDDGTAVEDAPVPATFALLANSPNPFNPTTTISFTLAEAGHVTLDVYNTAGQKVASLMEGEMTAGYHQAIWNARGFATGIYVTRLTVDGLTKTGKMTLMK